MERARPGKRAILIAGPTASGKSALAVEVARRRGGTVVNADAMQVYADLPILTAQPPAAEQAAVEHRLFGHVDAAEPYSVGRWLREVGPVLDDLWADGRTPVLVGGTGLYLKALTQGLSAIPSIPEEIRSRLRTEALLLSAPELHARLAAVDPPMAARLRPSDPQRILRALEVIEGTGRSLAAYQAERAPAVLPMAAIDGVQLVCPRSELYGRIDRRFDAMLAEGAFAEVERLAARGLNPSLPAMRALGVPSLLKALDGTLPIEAATAEAKTVSRNYARRQETFMRHQLPGLVQRDPIAAQQILLGD